MTASSRFIRARVVDFSGPDFAGEVAGPKPKLSAKQRKIRAKLRRARALKRRIASLRAQRPLLWKAAVKKATVSLRLVLVDLRALGWKPKAPTRARKPGEDELDATLDDIPDAEPGETEEPDEGIEDAAEPADDDATEGNWLDSYLGAEPAKKQPLRALMQRAERFVTARWSKPVPLGSAAQLQTKPGQRAMVATVSPGLYIVQIVSDDAARKIAGDNVGVLPLLLYPLVKNQVQKVLAPKPAAQPAAAQPAAAQPAPEPIAPTSTGCDCPPWRG